MLPLPKEEIAQLRSNFRVCRWFKGRDAFFEAVGYGYLEKLVQRGAEAVHDFVSL